MFKKPWGVLWPSTHAHGVCAWLGSRRALEIRPGVFNESVKAAFQKVGRRLAWVSGYRFDELLALMLP